jgi:heparin binding hemagglutinin HbhA
MTLPKNGDARKARTHAGSAPNGVLEQARTPFFAALGVSDLAANAMREVFTKARNQVTERAEAMRELPTDLGAIRERFDPAGLRKALDEYTDAVSKLYRRLAEHGEDTFAKLQPQVKRAIEQLEEVAETAQERVDAVASDARFFADDVLARMTRKTRSTGEKTARAATKVADRAAGAVDSLGDDIAHEVRSASRKVANTTSSARKTTAARSTRSTAASKSASTTKSTATARGTAAKAAGAKSAGTTKSSGSKSSRKS